MKTKILLIVCLICNYLYSQKIQLVGKVLDKITKQELSGATLKVKSQFFLTDTKGNYSVYISKEDLINDGIYVSYIGYNTIHLKKIDNRKFNVFELDRADNNLSDVTVYSGAKEIIAKAIKKIPFNYETKPFNLIGFQRSYESLNDTMYFLKDDALLNVYEPSYTDYKNRATVSVLQNRKYLKDFDKSLKDYARYRSNWYGSYNIVSGFDVVKREKIPDEDISNMWSLYDYDIQGIIDYNGYKVYVIDSKLKDSTKDGFTSTFLIDTASYAFVCYYVTSNNKLNQKMARKNAASDFHQSHRINYNKVGNKWFIKNISFEAGFLRERKELLINGSVKIDFLTISLDTLNSQIIPRNERVDENTYTVNVKKYVPAQKWYATDSLIAQPEYSKYITDIPMPAGTQELTN